MSVMQTRIAFKEKNLTIAQWALELGITPKALEARYLRGLRGKDLFKPMRDYASESGRSVQRDLLKKKQTKLAEDYRMERVAFKGMNMTLAQWAYKLRIDYEDLAMRFASGKSGAALFRVV